MLDYVYLGLYKSFAIILKVLPAVWIRKLMYGLAWLMYMLSAKHKKRIKDNLDLVFLKTLDTKEQKEIGIQAFMNLVDTVFGIVKRDGMSKEEVLRNVTFEGSDIIKEYQKEGKNFILITGHYGNWELLSQAIAINFNLTLVGVGRKIDSDMMDKILLKNREQFNVEMVYKKGAMKESIKAIKERKIMGILTDQAIRKNQSIEVDFFSKKATHTPLASILARKFDLDLIPGYISTEDYIHYKVKIYEPIKSIKTDNQEEDLAILTQLQADVMEGVIRENPKQWFWMHKRWK
ncbi:MAG: lipid A biosynthesis acyltransferase [Epsilonproteobacteria bacterium]|nr:MAG: lipid A biosynthesis acyltransferase [Campylobacterota bacterium]